MKIASRICLPVGALLAALMISSACNRTPPKKNPAEQLASLDSAYQSGVFTKEEYDAKKASILAAAPPTAPAPAPAAPAPVSPPPPPPTPIASAPAPTPQPVAPAPPRYIEPAAPPPPRVASAPTAPKPEAAPPPPQKTVSSKQPDLEPAPSDGCEDAEYKARKDGPQSRFFPQPMEKVRKATVDALKALDFTVHKDDTTGIEASKKRGIGVIVGAGGEREILQFETTTQDSHSGTLVTGRTKKSVVGRLAQKSWTAAVLAQTACNLR